jgi:hypothetical protein
MKHQQLDRFLLSLETIYGQSLMQARKDARLRMDYESRANVLIKAQGTDYVAITIEIGEWNKTYTIKG